MASWLRLFTTFDRAVEFEKIAWQCLRVLCGLALFLVGCNSGGKSGELSPQATSNPRMEQQAVENLLTLYRTAMVQEDIDRLAELLQSGSAVAQSQALFQQETPGQVTDQRDMDAPTFLANISAVFRTRTITALDQQEVTIAADHRSASFLEVESAIDPTTLEQQTRVMRTTWQITPDAAGDSVTFHISEVQQTLLATVTTPGQKSRLVR